MEQHHLKVPEQNAQDTNEKDKELPLDLEGQALQPVAFGPPFSIFSKRTRLWIVLAVSVSALISPFAATLYYPALNILATKLNVTSSLVNLSITTYMLAQAFAPAIIAGSSDNGGRRPAFLVCFGIYVVANIGLALQTNYAALLVLRIVQAAGCSATIALSMAVVADIATSAERGSYTGYATAGILLGPAFGPTLGGALAQYLGWRSIFWFLAIFGAVLFIVFGLCFPETCRNVVGNGSIPAKGFSRSITGYYYQKRHITVSEIEKISTTGSKVGKRKCHFPNPFTIWQVLREKESAIVLFYNGFFFNGQMIIAAALPYLLETHYGYNELHIGLCFIPLGIGSLLSALTMGHVVDWNFRRHAKMIGMEIIKRKQQDLRDFPIEKARLEVVLPNHVLGTAALIGFGWTIKYRTHISGPEIMLFFMGFGISSAFNITNALLIDLHRDKPATATATVNFVRCLISAGGVAAIVPLIQRINAGYAFTFIGLLYVIMIPMLPWMMKSGQKWRNEIAEQKHNQSQSK